MTYNPSEPPIKIIKDGVRNKGWNVSTSRGPIVRNKVMDEYRDKLNDPFVLPEMLYDSNYVEFLHEASGVRLSFNPFDALKAWIDNQLPPVQVSEASAWKKAREVEIMQQKAVQVHFDWTFTTPYVGSLVLPGQKPLVEQGRKSSAGEGDAEITKSNGAADASTSSAPSSKTSASSADSDVSDACVSVSVPELAWQEMDAPADKALLMARDPILFFSDTMLYESDLDDTGSCQLSVKLRVMPRCWLILLRFWLRVDNLMVRLRETRIFCRTDVPGAENTVYRETKHFECRYDDFLSGAVFTKPPQRTSLTGAGEATEAPSSPGSGSPSPVSQPRVPLQMTTKSLHEAFSSGDSMSMFLNAAAPVGLVLFKMEKLELPAPAEAATAEAAT